MEHLPETERLPEAHEPDKTVDGDKTFVEHKTVDKTVVEYKVTYKEEPDTRFQEFYSEEELYQIYRLRAMNKPWEYRWSL